MTRDQDMGRVVSAEELRAFADAEIARLHGEHGDPFRRQHVQLSPGQREFIEKLKDEAISVYALIAALPVCRERAMALSRLEEAIIFAVKAVTAKGMAEQLADLVADSLRGGMDAGR